MLSMGSVKRPWAQWLGLALLLPAMERRAATSAMATDLAASQGIGKGEYAAAFANFRALSVITAPLLYGNLYAHYAPKGKPGRPFFFAAAIVVVAEMLLRSLSDRECLPAAQSEKAEGAGGGGAGGGGGGGGAEVAVAKKA